MESSCRLQSELTPLLNDSLRVAPSLRVVTAIVLCVQPRVSKGHADLASSSPSSPTKIREANFASCTLVGAVSCDTCNTQRGLRSLAHLRVQFKPRTDDGHASPVQECLRTFTFLYSSPEFLTLVRFFGYHRIKPHNPLLVQVPVYSFEF